MHMIMSKREHKARRAIVVAKFRVKRLRDRVNKLVRFLYIITVTTLEKEKSFVKRTRQRTHYLSTHLDLS